MGERGQLAGRVDVGEPGPGARRRGVHQRRDTGDDARDHDDRRQDDRRHRQQRGAPRRQHHHAQRRWRDRQRRAVRAVRAAPTSSGRRPGRASSG